MPRNSSGTYSLPSGNPVVSNTLIQSTWANNTCSDLGSSITDSLDRNGRGAMLAALKNIDGTAVAPAVTFSSEGTLGIYRAAAGVLGIAAGGALVLSIASTGLTFTNPLVIPVGTAAAPSLTFTSNTNTGIYSPATNQVAVTTNGVGRVFVDASGNVGIGGANALGKLQVIGGDVVIDNAANYSIKNSGGTASSVMTLSAGNQLQFGNSGAVASMAWATGGTTRLNLTNTALQPSVIVVSALGESLRTTNDAGFISFYNTASTTRTGYLQANTGTSLALVSENGAALQLGTNSSTRVTISTGGNLGFNTTPNAWVTLQAIEGTSGALAFNGTGAMYWMQNLYYNGSNYIYRTTGPAGIYYQSGGQHAFYAIPSGTAGTAATVLSNAVVDPSGNFLVGSGFGTATSSAAGRGLIEINGSSSALLTLDVGATRKAYFIHDGTNATVSADAGSLQLNTGGTQRLIITSAGVIQDSAGNELGYKGLPQTNLVAGYTLVVGDRGKHIYQRSAGSVTVPASVFSVGDAVTIVNGTSGSISVVQGASVTMQQAGTTNTGNRTLLPFGVCTVICVASNNFHISGTIT